MGNDQHTSSPFDSFRADVTQAMADIVAGDRSATWRLHDLCGPAVRAMAFAEARRVGVWLTDDDLDEIQIDVALDHARRARSWDPDGAYPWIWARRRVLAMVHDHIGQFGVELDDVAEDEAPEPVAAIDDPVAVLHRLAGHDARVTALLHQPASPTSSTTGSSGRTRRWCVSPEYLAPPQRLGAECPACGVEHEPEPGR